MIRAGNDYEFVRPILPEDRISVTWTLKDIVERFFGWRHAAVRQFGRPLQRCGGQNGRYQLRDRRLPADGKSMISDQEHRDCPGGEVLPVLEKTFASVDLMAYGAATWD
ncbi:hypothetical protein [Bradyrhizobium sp. DASA03007]|uniref:hypothetical protein n=1 Tax=unclassified Bradyrhizobium TaxID=2631580 RepID=UPI003F71F16E